MLGGITIIERPNDECPHCGVIKPPHFLVCRWCWAEVPWALFVEHKTAAHNAYQKEHKTPPRLERQRLADLAILSYLKQHSTAIL